MRPGVDPESPDTARLIAEMLASLRRSRDFLLDPTPQNIDCCRMILGRCADQLGPLAGNPTIAARAARDNASSFQLARKELSSIAGLLGSAATFRRDLLQAMRAAADIPAIVIDASAQHHPPQDPEKVQRLHVLG